MKKNSITQIPVPREATEGDDPLSACLWVGYFTEAAIERGYDWSELPSDAINFADIWEYYGGVNNGGHSQYYENEEETRPRLKEMANFLGQIGLPGHRLLMINFAKQVVSKEKEILDLYDQGKDEDVKEFFYNFDDRYIELERGEGKLGEYLRDWILKQSWIFIEEGAADTARFRTLIPDPPQREERMAARLRGRHAENRGPLMAIVDRFLRR